MKNNTNVQLFYPFIIIIFLSMNCADRKSEFYINKNKIAAALEVYKLEENYKTIIHLKNTAVETKNIILLGEVRDSIQYYNDDVVYEVIQNSNHIYSHQIRFKNIVISEMLPTKYILVKDSAQAISLDYIGDLRSDFNLGEGSFKIRAIIIPSKVNVKHYYHLNDDEGRINNLIMDTIKTQFLTII